jgi:hypothetical protein
MEVIIIIFLREMEEERKEKHKENMFGFGCLT